MVASAAYVVWDCKEKLIYLCGREIEAYVVYFFAEITS